MNLTSGNVTASWNTSFSKDPVHILSLHYILFSNPGVLLLIQIFVVEMLQIMHIIVARFTFGLII